MAGRGHNHRHSTAVRCIPFGGGSGLRWHTRFAVRCRIGVHEGGDVGQRFDQVGLRKNAWNRNWMKRALGVRLWPRKAVRGNRRRRRGTCGQRRCGDQHHCADRGKPSRRTAQQRHFFFFFGSPLLARRLRETFLSRRWFRSRQRQGKPRLRG